MGQAKSLKKNFGGGELLGFHKYDQDEIPFELFQILSDVRGSTS